MLSFKLVTIKNFPLKVTGKVKSLHISKLALGGFLYIVYLNSWGTVERKREIPKQSHCDLTTLPDVNLTYCVNMGSYGNGKFKLTLQPKIVLCYVNNIILHPNT